MLLGQRAWPFWKVSTCVGSYFFLIVDGVENMFSATNILSALKLLKTKGQMKCRLIFPILASGDWKIEGDFFFIQNQNFNLFLTQNISKTSYTPW